MVTSGQFLPGLWLPSSEVEGNAAIRLHCCVDPDCHINQTGFIVLVNLCPKFGLEPEVAG